MKRLLKLSVLGVLVLGLATSCLDWFPQEDEKLDAPVDLVALDITESSATLSWAGVTDAESYKINLNGEIFTAEENTYSATELTPETEYTWCVQAIKGELQSPWSVSATFTTGSAPIPPLGTPENLTVYDISVNSAVLTWDVVQGATGYEVRIANGTFNVLENVHIATGLTGETEYEWSVRAIDLSADRVSEWASSSFTTGDGRTRFWETRFVQYRKNWYVAPSANFNILFHDHFALMPGSSGVEVELDIIATPVEDGEDVQFLNIPPGTYTINSTMRTGTIYMYGDTEFLVIVDGYTYQNLTVRSGSVVISGDASNYHMTFDIGVAEYPDRVFRYVWDGPLEIPNPNYVPIIDDEIDFGRIPMLNNYVGYYNRPFFNSDSDAYVVQALEEGVRLEGTTLLGTGWVVANIQFHAAGDTGLPIPDGEYQIMNSLDPGTVMWGWANAFRPEGLWVRRLENDVITNVAMIRGTVTSTYTDGLYEIDVDATGTNGVRYFGTVYSDGEPYGVMPKGGYGIGANGWQPYWVTNMNTPKGAITDYSK
jgi:hypothetical protein